MAEQIQKITHIEHIIKRPDSYVGPVSRITEPYWVLSDNKFTLKNTTYSPALLKIFDEILVNAIDRNSLFPTQVKNISVLIDKTSGAISIENNGPLGGISVLEHPTEKLWNPELTFGHLLTSTNYDDSKDRLVGGRNGYGAKLANIYSKVFVITICDSENQVKYSQKWENNMTVCGKPKITKYSKATSSVNICFVPDWKKFGMEGMDEDLFKVFEKRVYDAVICTSVACRISFQENKLDQMSTEKYAKMYLPDDTPVVSLNTERWSVTVAPSPDGFQQVSFVNGICTTKGGSHVDHVVRVLTTGIIEELKKKATELKPQFVKNTMFVMVRSTLVNPSFSSQVKSECTLKPNEFGSSFDCDTAFIKKVLKTGIQNEVLAISKFKEMKELKKTDGGARKSTITGIPKLDDADWAGTGKSSQCTLIVTEGDSAKTLAVAGISVVGRETYGVFPLRGKCKNVRDASVKQLMANQEFSDLKKILGLQQDKDYKTLSELRYGRLMIMTDADNDGSHIKGLILNMFHCFWPSLLSLGFIVSLVTPIIKATSGKTVTSFYTDSEFTDWYKNNQSGWKIKYYKGLGTSTSVEAREYFRDIKRLTVAFSSDQKTDESIVLAFDKTKADARKTWLLEATSKTDLSIGYGKISKLPISEFIHKDLIHFSLADLKRSVAHMCDGFKPSQRKVLYACFQKNLGDGLKVAQLAAYVAEKTSYHHGEVSMADTIVKLAHDFVGSNNMNLLEPVGQFGTRLMGGKDSASTRYIFTKLTPSARKCFDERDDAILEYLEDDGKQIEPEYFVPVIPMVLVNGTEGIGTGFSSFVPPYNPEDIKKALSQIIKEEPIKQLVPWFRGFKGTVVQDSSDPHSWILEAAYKVDGTKVTITDLPPGRWTSEYKEHLDELKENGTLDYKNMCTDETVHFVVDYKGKDLIKDLKLQKTIRTSNMHLFHPEKGIVKYNTAEEIIVDFCKIRLRHYRSRKEYLLKKWESDLSLVSNKARFISEVINGDLVVFKRNRIVIERDLQLKHYDKIDEGYNYLFNIKTYQYTNEAIKDLDVLHNRLVEQVNNLKSMKVTDLWELDLQKI